MAKTNVLINGEMYKAVVMKVTKAEDGRPRVLHALYDEESTKLEGGEEFIVAYLPKTVLKLKKAN